MPRIGKKIRSKKFSSLCSVGIRKIKHHLLIFKIINPSFKICIKKLNRKILTLISTPTLKHGSLKVTLMHRELIWTIFFSDLNLQQLVGEPTHFFNSVSKPSFIDIILTDQPNLVLSCGVRPSRDHLVHHQMTFCKLNFKIPPSL